MKYLQGRTKQAAWLLKNSVPASLCRCCATACCASACHAAACAARLASAGPHATQADSVCAAHTQQLLQAGCRFVVVKGCQT